MDSSFTVLTAGIVMPLCAGAAWVFYKYHIQPRCKWTIDEKTQQALRRYVLMESTHGKPHSVLQTFREYAKQNRMIKEILFTPDQDIFLADAVKQTSPRTVVVLGTQCGYSAIRVLSLLPPDGNLYAVEAEDSMADSAEEMILVSGFKNNQFKLLCQHPVNAIYILHSKFGLEKVDLVLFDFKSDGYLQGLNALAELGLLYPGALILLNNMGRLAAKDFVKLLENSEHYRVVTDCQSLLKVEYKQSILGRTKSKNL
ncbi:PREDICTED: catechol O-methyltransferase-like [Nanorana parkeri]|uniref:catechol O-methyltransferase-like n=1 Tax=Nanorana parkeri TaxID=125878 RepID=UPI0008540E2E|nr:PREDICTED: catechol O-methyltransferase-like [Nanorana parkeri]